MIVSNARIPLIMLSILVCAFFFQRVFFYTSCLGKKISMAPFKQFFLMHLSLTHRPPGWRGSHLHQPWALGPLCCVYSLTLLDAATAAGVQPQSQSPPRVRWAGITDSPPPRQVHYADKPRYSRCDVAAAPPPSPSLTGRLLGQFASMPRVRLFLLPRLVRLIVLNRVNFSYHTKPECLLVAKVISLCV